MGSPRPRADRAATWGAEGETRTPSAPPDVQTGWLYLPGPRPRWPLQGYYVSLTPTSVLDRELLPPDWAPSVSNDCVERRTDVSRLPWPVVPTPSAANPVIRPPGVNRACRRFSHCLLRIRLAASAAQGDLERIRMSRREMGAGSRFMPGAGGAS